jgi:hypothetical protein
MTQADRGCHAGMAWCPAPEVVSPEMTDPDPATTPTDPFGHVSCVRRFRPGSRSVVSAAMPSLLLIAIALVLILVLLPAAIVAAGT